jgi:hypothetical protein
MNSFDPIDGNTSKSPVTPKFLIDQLRSAVRNASVPATTGYPGESLADAKES